MNHVQIVLSTVMRETYFIPLASERRPFGAWGEGGLTRYRDPQECNVLFILVKSKDFPESAKPYAYMVRDSLGVQRAASVFQGHPSQRLACAKK